MDIFGDHYLAYHSVLSPPAPHGVPPELHPRPSDFLILLLLFFFLILLR